VKGSPPLSNLSTDDAKYLYDQICANIRATDEISLKLLGFVPLVSGAGITFLISSDAVLSNAGLAAIVGVLGAFVTGGLYSWEVRNANACAWLVEVGSQLEHEVFGLPQGQFLNRPRPSLRGHSVGKRDAEKIVYGVTMIAWLLLPLISSVVKPR
jgi:hypothetical protein